ncbi:hypothetical protein L198_04830 [Cryptococcus wingfieldii CBS 7118]|uniref:Uncharacterized protein n=1 Tax=Cryptococcus wingfieldii CBS 7118 TaxID=1295528 RepID=A0A1E3J1G6_9TREE|nr:hypothetical protein L198_04830 [Cryptococcus wingfieldii CBS 7118]ODN94689.1 hypothetical protein L198_04830 [Cryptococcus wingfieldii CBS 7118]
MFPKVLFALAASVAASATAIKRDESHSVNLVNNCGSGNAVFLYENTGQQGSTTVSGPLRGGVAWVDGFSGADCQSSGVNCGIVEFTLIDSSHKDENGNSYQNSADYSLLKGSNGNHQFTYNMDFALSCDNGSPGTCTGDSADACPGAYLGEATTGGAPTQCVADSTGITITFC